MTKRIEPKAKTPQSIAKQTLDLRKEFEECFKLQKIVMARALDGAPYQYTNTDVQTLYKGFCAGWAASNTHHNIRVIKQLRN